jgi:oligopeptide/dipeptide ABC transporter ATP-binding protein
MMSTPLLEVEDLTIKYATEEGALTAVSNASFTVDEGTYFGLVGESGCGKSTIAKSLIGGLDDNGWIDSGSIRYRGSRIDTLTQEELNDEIRWTEISLIPQGSMNSLDPLKRISSQAISLAQVHTGMTQQEARSRLEDLFDIVGLQQSRIDDYPHQFSGGMQQRAIIAMALLLEPSLIIADEPTTALDVIMQDQIFSYLDDIREETRTSMVLITHDTGVVFESCDELAIMHAGQVAETGSVYDVYDDTRHPYAVLLQEAMPGVEKIGEELQTIEGEPPQLHGEVRSCTFADRCPWAVDECTEGAPPLESVSDTESDHKAACVRQSEVPELARAQITTYDENNQ